jgi:hypothetical protein
MSIWFQAKTAGGVDGVIWFPPGEKHRHGVPATARPMTHIAIVEQLEGKSADYLRRELTPLPVGHRHSPPPRSHDANENVCDTIGSNCCDKSTITGCSIKGDRPQFEGYPQEQRAPNLRELAEADESCSTCAVASSGGSVRKRAPWIIRVQNEERNRLLHLGTLRAQSMPAGRLLR